MRSRVVVLLGAALALAFAPAPLSDPSKEDRKALQGTWRVVEIQRNGTVMLPLAPDALLARIEGSRWRWTNGESKVAGPWRLLVDAEKKPRALDLMPLDGAEGYAAVYELEGDNLKICYRRTRQPWVGRPRDFNPSAHGTVLMLLKRKP